MFYLVKVTRIACFLHHLHSTLHRYQCDDQLPVLEFRQKQWDPWGTKQNFAHICKSSQLISATFIICPCCAILWAVLPCSSTGPPFDSGLCTDNAMLSAKPKLLTVVHCPWETSITFLLVMHGYLHPQFVGRCLYGLLAKLHNVHLLHAGSLEEIYFENYGDCLSTLVYDDTSAEQTLECCNFISNFFFKFYSCSRWIRIFNSFPVWDNF